MPQIPACKFLFVAHTPPPFSPLHPAIGSVPFNFTSGHSPQHLSLPFPFCGVVQGSSSRILHVVSPHAFAFEIHNGHCKSFRSYLHSRCCSRDCDWLQPNMKLAGYQEHGTGYWLSFDTQILLQRSSLITTVTPLSDAGALLEKVRVCNSGNLHKSVTVLNKSN
jgi:hypothetical protein